MQVLLLAPPVHPLIDRESMRSMPPLAIYVLATVIREQGHLVEVLDPLTIQDRIYGQPRSCQQTWLKELLRNTDIIGISCNSFNWGVAKQLIDQISEIYPELPVIVGGVHPTLCAEHLIRTTKINYLMRGEGEQSFPKFLECLESKAGLEQVPGLIYRRSDGTVVCNDVASRIDLDKVQKVPLPAFDLMPADVYRTMPVESSRGCKFNCAFCSIVHRGSWRSYNQEKFLTGLEQSVTRWGSKFKTNNVYFVDDCFTADPRRAGELLSTLDSTKLQVRVVLEARATDLLNKHLVEKIPRRKVARIAIGIEAGYDEGLKRIRKGLTVELIDQALKNLEQADLLGVTHLSFIIGFPWESEQKCLDTINFAAALVQLFGVQVNLNWLFLCPSDLWKMRSRYGIYSNEGIFDKPEWMEDLEVFSQTHPRIDKAAVQRIEAIISSYAAMGLNLRCP